MGRYLKIKLPCDMPKVRNTVVTDEEYNAVMARWAELKLEGYADHDLAYRVGVTRKTLYAFRDKKYAGINRYAVRAIIKQFPTLLVVSTVMPKSVQKK